MLRQSSANLGHGRAVSPPAPASYSAGLQADGGYFPGGGGGGAAAAAGTMTPLGSGRVAAGTIYPGVAPIQLERRHHHQQAWAPGTAAATPSPPSPVARQAAVAPLYHHQPVQPPRQPVSDIGPPTRPLFANEPQPVRPSGQIYTASGRTVTPLRAAAAATHQMWHPSSATDQTSAPPSLPQPPLRAMSIQMTAHSVSSFVSTQRQEAYFHEGAGRPLTPPPPAPSTPRQQPHAWTNSQRSITPPPVPIVSPAEAKDEWIAMSTGCMSPFTILRIKALIELSSIPDDGEEERVVIKTKCEPAKVPGGARLRRSRTEEDHASQLERVRATERFDLRCVTELNYLLAESKALSAASGGAYRPPGQHHKMRTAANLVVVNQRLAEEKRALGIRDDPAAAAVAPADNISADGSRSLQFSPGATLICFDSNDKPKKIRDNHAKLFQLFVQQQAQALQQQQQQQQQRRQPPANESAYRYHSQPELIH